MSGEDRIKMSVYLVAQIQIHEKERYAEYSSGFMDTFSQHKGEVLSVDESPGILEGEWPFTRTVLLTFPSREDAEAWYFSEEYQALAQHRFAASDGNIIMISGLENDRLNTAGR